jgi:hypothetical protein
MDIVYLGDDTNPDKQLQILLHDARQWFNSDLGAPSACNCSILKPDHAYARFEKVVCYIFSVGTEIINPYARFMFKCVLEPMQKREPGALGLFQPIIDECILKKQVRRTLGYLVLATWSSKRHFLYSGRSYKFLDPIRPWLLGLEQSEPIWSSFRPFIIGGSTLSALFGTSAKYAARNGEIPPTPDDIVRLMRGEKTKSDFPPNMPPILDHGHAVESLGFDLINHFIVDHKKEELFEAGMAVHSTIPYFGHSPDGLARDRETGKLVYMIEVKCQKLKYTCYDETPPLYLPQNVQGMIVHGVKVCYFIAVHYDPLNPLKPRCYGKFDNCDVMIEKIELLPHVETIFTQCCQDFIDRVTGDKPLPVPAMPDVHEFWENKSNFKHQPLIHEKNFNFRKALGDEKADHYKAAVERLAELYEN